MVMHDDRGNALMDRKVVGGVVCSGVVAIVAAATAGCSVVTAVAVAVVWSRWCNERSVL